MAAEGWSTADLARATKGGISESTIGRWKNRGWRPDVESVRIVAKVFDYDIRKALVASGIITAKELNAPAADPSRPDLTVVSDDALVDEIRKRLSKPWVVTDPPQPRRRQAAAAVASENGSNGSASTPVTTGPRSTAIAVHGHEEAPPPRGEGEGADDALHDSASS
jgi:transcriptional regulator with XRE-family HTH domain